MFEKIDANSAKAAMKFTIAIEKTLLQSLDTSNTVKRIDHICHFLHVSFPFLRQARLQKSPILRES